MANEIYHRSNWGNAVNDNAWGDVYQKFDATNEMFIRSDNYENSNETDKLMAAINPKPSILLTPTAYDNGSLHSVKPVLTPFADFDFTRGTAATRVNEKGLVANVTDTNLPRIDYTGGTGQILLEPQSTNLVTDSAGGNYGNAPGSEILTTAPDGTNTAVRPVPDSTSDRYQYTISGGSYATDSKLTYTWYRKRITTPIDTSHTGDLKIQILVNCTQVGSTTQIETDVNGFDRFQAVFNITDGSAATLIRGYFGQSIGVGNSSIAYWGHQVEPLEFSTSLILTSGSTSTRNADVCNNSGSSDLISSTEGVLYLEVAALTSINNFQSISLSDGTNQNNIRLLLNNALNRASFQVKAGNTGQVFKNIDMTDITDFNKIALKYKENDFAAWLNGVEVATDTSGTVPTINQLNFTAGGAFNNFEGKVKSVAVYKEALTDAQLTALTT